MTAAALAQGGVPAPSETKPSAGGVGLSFSFTWPSDSGDSVDHEPNEILILWRTDEEAKAGQRFMQRRYGLTPAQVDPLTALGLIMGQYKLGRSPTAQELKAQLRRARPGWIVDLNTRHSLLGDHTTLSTAPPRLYALQQLGLSAGDDALRSSMSVGVADTAVELGTALRVGQLVQHDTLEKGDVPAPTDHGTAVARLMAGAPQANGFSGVANGIDLYWARTLRMVDGRSRSSTAIMSRAVNWLAAQGVAVINISQGGRGDDVLKEVFARLVAGPVTVVAAAGNSGPGAGPIYPAAYPGVLAVTAIDNQSRVYAQANHGAYISLAAPGVDVWVPATRPSSNFDADDPRSGNYLSGTSFASALMAGALVHADAGLWRTSASERIARLCAGARDLGEPGRDTTFGCGLLQFPRTETTQAGSSPPQ